MNAAAATNGRVRIGARRSPLARAQVDLVANALAEQGVEVEFVPIRTQGDIDRRQLTQIGGTGVFTAAVRDALLDGSIDVAVHSCKDLPTASVDGLQVIAYPAREDTRDVLVVNDPSILGLLTGSAAAGDGRRVLIGTGAPRREVQLQQLAAEHGLVLDIEPIRGNVDTRLEQVRSGRFDGTVLAAAGLSRLGRFDPGSESSAAAATGGGLTIGGLPATVLPHDRLLPAPGQGALAVETTTDLDSQIERVLTRLDDAATRAEVLAERRFLAVLEAGCTAPVGARAEVSSAPADGHDGRAVRYPGADLTLVAVIGKTRGDDQAERSAEGIADLAGADISEGGSDPKDPSRERDRLSNRGRLVMVSGRGSTADPAELGGRLAELALSQVDRSEFGLPDSTT
ncbi:hydroxymethylbilane synthase [Microlunatus soli]|uniref:Hydroxymethylbilane synthase n=1 Tax=Microlunatus soli TaxID=630515 RepID=A0A1H1SB89_9ACTN|nr:hydroxymethylbilane synthase [Microlunatus soli]SDS45245.1 hydroxymethylbilane synthase [Microlunatus soli]